MNRSSIKQQAKEDIRQNYVPWLVVGLITLSITIFQGYFRLTDSNTILETSARVQVQVRWLNLFEILLLVPFSRLAIHLCTGRFRSIKESLFKNEQWLRDIGALLLVALYTLLWTLLFIIPGIIKGYSYSLVPYILAEDDTISITEAIALSQRLTEGYKWELFVMDWSFILWDLATSLTIGLVGFYAIPYKKATWTRYYLQLSR
ncbi:DUF975 family protein [Jeotgalibaca porci]|uniref:DUF975 family protein n=1 Tax=Jeotgalibaca porci TaxID=1868793 RepID=UPI003F90818D